MQKNENAATIENIITVTTQDGTKIHLNDKLIRQLYSLGKMDEIPEIINILKDGIIDVSTFKIILDKEENTLADNYNIDPDFFLYIKEFIEVLKAIHACNTDKN